MDKLFNLQKNMVEYYKGDAKRIQHFTKVHSFAKFIGLGENLDEHTQFILESAALTHDIGIKISEESMATAMADTKKLKALPKLKKC